jgi:lipopolysaccharide/colanic/teichoic acid biosynthesis glycosyltransferase
MNWKVRLAKRALDIVAATIGLTVTAPLFPFIAAAIKLDSRGSVFFRQRRAGSLLGVEHKDGRMHFRFAEFDMPKFRTMRTDAENATGAVLARPGDPRVTRVGRFLRRTRLDELPQLWCVLRGHMSLVGPRPERPELLNNLALAIPLFEERMRGVKPGITGLAQINLGYTGAAPPGSHIEKLRDAIVNPFKLEEADGAEADDMRLKLLYDLAYTATLDDFKTYLLMEMEIILKTPVTMVRGSGR